MPTRNSDRRPSGLERITRALARLWSGAEAKASLIGPLIAIESYGGPVWTPRDYAAFAREGVMQNAVVYRCVRMISEAAASVPLILYDGADEVETTRSSIFWHGRARCTPRPTSTRPGTASCWSPATPTWRRSPSPVPCANCTCCAPTA